MKLMNLIVIVTAAALLSGCRSSVNPDDSANMFPDLPDNAYCFRKIQEYKNFVQSPQNAKSENGFNVVTPRFVPDPYLVILKERGAVLSSTVLLNSLQTKELLKLNPPEVLFWGGPYLDGGQSPITLYYLPENQEKVDKLLPKITQTMTKPVYWDSGDLRNFLQNPDYRPENPSEMLKAGWISSRSGNSFSEWYGLLNKQYGWGRFSNSNPSVSLWCVPEDQMVIVLFYEGKSNETIMIAAPYKEENQPPEK